MLTSRPAAPSGAPPPTLQELAEQPAPMADWTIVVYGHGDHNLSFSLQRDMHDWRAVFAFTQAANGNFAFNFFIALKAEPDLKFDYNRNTYRGRR